MVDCRLLLGSNLGDRERHIESGLDGLNRLSGCRVLKCSRLFETAPVGGGKRHYLNLAALIKTELSPIGLLLEAKRLEALEGRKPAPRWSDRTLDIDILSYGGLKLKTAWITLPHPEISRRAFTLAPLADISPSWKPDGKRSVFELLRRLNPDPATVRIYL